MITLPEDTVGRGTQLLYPRVSTCLPFTLDLTYDLVGVHLTVGAPTYQTEEELEQMKTYTKGRPIRAAYAVGMLSVWQDQRADAFQWPTFADTVRQRFGKMFPVYAFDGREVDDEVVITASMTGVTTVRIDVSSSKMFKMKTAKGAEDGEAVTLTAAKVRGLNGGIVQGIKRHAYPNRDVLVKSKSLSNLFRKTRTLYMQNMAEF